MVDLVPRAVAEGDTILPVSLEGDRLHLAVASPGESERALAEVRFVTGREISPYVAVLSALRGAIQGCYDGRGRGEATWRGAAVPPGAPPGIAVHPAGARAGPGASGEAVEEVTFDAEIDFVEAEEEVVHAVAVRAGAFRVLVVDDEPAIRLLVQRALEHRGYEVELAADGAEALEKAGRGRFDLVLLDAMLPKIHGFEVALRLRSERATREIPIVIMSAIYRGWRFAQDARQSYGAQDYIEKPFRLDDLLRRIEAVLASPPPRQERASPAPALSRGRAALAAGRPDEALAAFEEATRIDPFSAEAHHALGEALHARGDAFRAMSALERAVELQPSLLPALRSLAALYLAKGFRAKAAETLERAVLASPDAALREELRRALLRLL